MPSFGQSPFWGERVVGVLAVGVEPVLVLVELRVLDDERAAGVRARVAERVVLPPGVVDDLVALLLAGPDVVARVVHVAGVGVVPGTAVPVAGEDPVLGGGDLLLSLRQRRIGVVPGARGIQIGAVVAPAADRAALGAAVPPDLVAGAAVAAGAAEEVACGQVLDRDVVRLPDLDPVQPGRAAARLRTEVLVGRVVAAR